MILPAGSTPAGEILTSHVRSIDATARPIRFTGARASPAVLAEVRGKLAALCGMDD